jgi:hypothetical protein
MTETATPVWGSPSSNEIKLEVGQIWKSRVAGVRKILMITDESVFYSIVSSYRKEGMCDLNYFRKDKAHELLPCWPEKKKVMRAKAIVKRDILSAPFELDYFFKDKEEIVSHTNATIVEFPYGAWKEFDE